MSPAAARMVDRKSTRLNSSHRCISYAVFCLKKHAEDTNRWRDSALHNENWSGRTARGRGVGPGKNGIAGRKRFGTEFNYLCFFSFLHNQTPPYLTPPPPAGGCRR